MLNYLEENSETLKQKEPSSLGFLKQQIQKRMKSHISYEEKFFKQIPTSKNYSMTASPDEFFKEIAHRINLEGTYLLKKC